VCHPKNLKSAQPLRQTAREWASRLWRTLSPRGWAKGVEGAQAPSQGAWGMCPQVFKLGGE